MYKAFPIHNRIVTKIDVYTGLQNYIAIFRFTIHDVLEGDFFIKCATKIFEIGDKYFSKDYLQKILGVVFIYNHTKTYCIEYCTLLM